MKINAAIIVDDNESTRNYMSRLCEKFGIENIHCFENGEDFLKSELTQTKETILFVDQNLPDMKGLDVVGRLLENENFGNNTFRIHLMSANDLSDELNLDEISFTNFYINQKPFRIADFEQIIKD